MPDFATLDVAVEGPVGTITLDRPDRLNAISRAMVEDLTSAAGWFDRQPGVRAVVVAGAGRCFSAGADIEEFRSRYAEGATPDRAGSVEEARRGAAMADAVESMRAVTVAAVHGAAMGGAVALLAACDLRIVADDARIVVPEAAMGLPLAWGAVPRLVRELGPGVSRQLLLTGRPLLADEAVRRGFAVSTHPPAELPAAAKDLAARVAGVPAYAAGVLLHRVRAVAEGRTPDDDAVAIALAMERPEVLAAGRDYLATLDAPAGRSTES